MWEVGMSLYLGSEVCLTQHTLKTYNPNSHCLIPPLNTVHVLFNRGLQPQPTASPIPVDASLYLICTCIFIELNRISLEAIWSLLYNFFVLLSGNS